MLWGLSLTGFPAWLVWLGVHLMQLIGFRNRIAVMLDWANAYITYQRSSRIILEDAHYNEATDAASGDNLRRAG